VTRWQPAAATIPHPPPRPVPDPVPLPSGPDTIHPTSTPPRLDPAPPPADLRWVVAGC